MKEENKIPIIGKISSGLLAITLGFLSFAGLVIVIDRFTVDAGYLAQILLLGTFPQAILLTVLYYKISMKYIWGEGK